MPSHNPQNANILELSQIFARTCFDHQNIARSSPTFKKTHINGSPYLITQQPILLSN
jgi:hypothetical protein